VEGVPQLLRGLVLRGLQRGPAVNELLQHLSLAAAERGDHRGGAVAVRAVQVGA